MQIYVEPTRLTRMNKVRARASELNSIIDLAFLGATYARPKGCGLVPEDGSRKIGITSGLRIAHECLIGRPLLIPRRVKRFAASAALKESGTTDRSGVYEKLEAARSDSVKWVPSLSYGIQKIVTTHGFQVDQALVFERHGDVNDTIF